VNFSLSPERLPNLTGAYEQIVEAVRAIPGVVSAGAVKNAPMRGTGERVGFTTPGMVVPAGQDSPTAALLHVSDGYFHTIGARVLEGREFTTADRAGAPMVVLINAAFARQWFPGKRASEQRLILNGTSVPIAGVVNDIRQVGMGQPAVPTIYIDNQQNPRVQTTLVLRTAGDPLAVVAAVRNVIWSVDRLQPITSIFTFDDAVSGALARPRLLTVVLSVFGALGLALGAIGLYGVLAFLVTQRQREIGVRLAIGARPRDVRAMFVRRGLVMAAAGVAIGLGGSLLIGPYLNGVLYGVTPTDLTTYAGVSVVLMAVAAIASWMPARRAAAVDPAVTLRAD
jgi:predicted permease